MNITLGKELTFVIQDKASNKSLRNTKYFMRQSIKHLKCKIFKFKLFQL